MSNAEHLANVMVEAFIAAVERGVDLVPVVADSTSTAKIAPFIKQFPGRLVNVGIAEQSMVGTAAGLALGGKVAVTCNAAPFLISRANEQIKVDVCYNNTNVKLFGLNAGASYGPLASTHHAIDDLAVMRGFGNIQIFAPSSPRECRQIIDYAIGYQGPVYIRLDGKALPELHDESYRFVPGAIVTLREGDDIALVATGSTVHEIVDAAQIPAAEFSSQVVVGFTVDETGNVTQWRFLDNTCEGKDSVGVEPATPRTREAMTEALGRLEKWTPAMKDGKPTTYSWRLTMRLRYDGRFTGRGAKGEGVVRVRFYIEPDGKITIGEVIKSPDEKLSREMIRVIRSSKGKWTPRKVRGVPQRTAYEYGVNFLGMAE